jgi:hypothetical protein
VVEGEPQCQRHHRPNHGTLIGGQLLAGQKWQAFHLDGLDDYVHVPNPTLHIAQDQPNTRQPNQRTIALSTTLSTRRSPAA